MKSGPKGRLFAGAAIAVLMSGAAWALQAQPMLQLAKGGVATEARIWLASAEGGAEDGAPADKMWRGDDKGEPATDDLSDAVDGSDDGMAWTGGDPDFCEACGGVVVDGEEPETLTTEVDPELGDPMDDVVEVDDGTMWAGDPDFCEACGGVVMDAGELMMTMTGSVQQQRGGDSQMSGRAPGSGGPEGRCGMAGVAHRCGDR